VGWLEDLCERRVEDFLEVGSGEGFTLEAANKKGWHTVGVEVSPAFAEPVSSRLGVEVLLVELEDLSLSDESFDIIYVNSVLEHVSEPEAFFLFAGVSPPPAARRGRLHSSP